MTTSDSPECKEYFYFSLLPPSLSLSLFSHYLFSESVCVEYSGPWVFKCTYYLYLLEICYCILTIDKTISDKKCRIRIVVCETVRAFSNVSSR